MGAWNQRTEEVTIDVSRILRALWKKAWLIVVAILVCSLIAYLYTTLLITPVYRSSFTAYVNNRLNTDGINSTSTGDLNASIALVYLYEEIITSRSVLLDAAEKCGIDASYESLAKRVTTSNSRVAAIITVNVNDPDPVKAAMLATAIAEVAPEHVARVVDGSSMRIVDPPVEPTRQYSPNASQNILLGAVAGLLVSFTVVVITELVYDKVRGSEDMEARYQIPVIGGIPDINQAVKVRDKYGYSKGGYDRK